MNKIFFRGYLVFYAFLAACVILVLKIFFISINKDRIINSINIPEVQRGAIYDRMGRLLAEQVETFNISLWLEDLRDFEKDESESQRDERFLRIAESLAGVSFIPTSELYNKFIDKDVTYIDLMKRANIDVKETVEKIVAEQNIKGIRITNDYLRYYPNGSLASNLLGYVNNDRHGGAGIEYSFEHFLAPPSLGSSRKIEEGKSLELTIDANLQGIVEARVKRSFHEHKASSAVAIIADSKSGAILSYVNLPTFDSNFYNVAPTEALKNRAVTVAYEPGSVFKVFSIASLIDMGLIHEDDKFFCDGAYEIDAPDERIIIKCQGVHGEQSIRQVLSNSCNTGTAQAAERIGRTELYDHLQNFGFGKKTGVPLPGETSGLLSNPKEWSARSKPTISMGQEVAVSALQVVQAATAIANNGQMLKPQFIKRVLNRTGKVEYQFKKEVVSEPITVEVANRMLKLLSFGVTEGIARRMYIEGLQIAAKTGTSQKYDYDTGAYSDDNYVASTLAIFPADKPQYILYVAFDSPQGRSYFGSAVVAPLMRDIVLDLIPYMGIELSNTTTYAVDKNINLKSGPIVEKEDIKVEPKSNITKTDSSSPASVISTSPAVNDKILIDESILDNQPINDNKIPNFVGLSVRDALTMVKDTQITLKIDGDENSIVEEQFPPASSLLKNKATVILYMKK